MMNRKRDDETMIKIEWNEVKSITNNKALKRKKRKKQKGKKKERE